MNTNISYVESDEPSVLGYGCQDLNFKQKYDFETCLISASFRSNKNDQPHLLEIKRGDMRTYTHTKKKY